ncbi:hypothetical protein ACFXJ8_18345 [Nonomuraea sp. NPDC059194]|uniref:hypothetical protein n=1 Tax=Nonomuraea sp. NPDC059194 TaxID=3346764 RepID=UPI00368ABBB3
MRISPTGARTGALLGPPATLAEAQTALPTREEKNGPGPDSAPNRYALPTREEKSAPDAPNRYTASCPTQARIRREEA